MAERIKAGGSDDEIAEELYLRAFSRMPSDDERLAIRETIAAGPSREEAWQDIVWAMLNCSEFVFNH